METIGSSELWSFRDNSSQEVRLRSNAEIRRSKGHFVSSYLELARKVSVLQYRNPSFVLLFRGQSDDYRNQKNHTTLKPSLFRPRLESKQNPDIQLLSSRFEALVNAERQLVEASRNPDWKLESRSRIERQRILRWALLQHYEVCPTPLLDVTHSLRIAASFASKESAEEVFLYVLGVPNISGAITASAESGLQILRLSSVCPPSAVRPHIQEGYLLGEYPDLQDIEQKQAYEPYEIDFARRLIAKFRFSPHELWLPPTEFPKVGHSALYPDADDPLLLLTAQIKVLIDSQYGQQIY